MRWGIRGKRALCFLAASILVPTAVLVFLITSGVDLRDALLYGLVLPLLILLVYVLISRNAPRKIRLYTIIANPTIPVALLIVGVIVGAFFILWVGGSVSADLDDRELDVSAPFVNEHMPYQDINGVDLRNDVNYGSRVSGYAGNDVLSGNYRNDEFGSHKLAVHRSTGECIVVHHNGGILVFNLDSSDKTERCYNDLMSRIPGNMT